MGDQWLLERGLWTERVADTLLGYAYMQPGVEKVSIEINSSELAPKLTYKVKLEKSFSRKYLKIRELSEKPSLLNKLRMLLLMKKGVPSAGSLENMICLYASNIIPRSYSVEVLLEN